MSAELVAAFRGLLPNGDEITVDVWADGQATYILRPKGAVRWGIPVPMARQEVAS